MSSCSFWHSPSWPLLKRARSAMSRSGAQTGAGRSVSALKIALRRRWKKPFKRASPRPLPFISSSFRSEAGGRIGWRHPSSYNTRIQYSPIRGEYQVTLGEKGSAKVTQNFEEAKRWMARVEGAEIKPSSDFKPGCFELSSDQGGAGPGQASPPLGKSLLFSLPLGFSNGLAYRNPFALKDFPLAKGERRRPLPSPAIMTQSQGAGRIKKTPIGN